MTTPMLNRMHRHTRPADFVSKSRKSEAVAFSRPGGSSFSFSGEFPVMGDQQPVEAMGQRRRNYMASHNTGSYQAIRRDDARRMPPVNKHGVHIMPALVMFMALAVVLGSIFLTHMDERSKVQSAIDQKRIRESQLAVECADINNAISAQSNDMNIRQLAVRIGLINSRGVNVIYLDPPKDAVITMPDSTVIQSLASIWGQ